jgi:hypothetical protein
MVKQSKLAFPPAALQDKRAMSQKEELLESIDRIYKDTLVPPTFL